MKRNLLFLLASVLVASSACGRTGDVDPVATAVSSPAHVDKPVVQVALVGATLGGAGLPAQHAVEGARLAFDLANEEGALPVDVVGVASDTQQSEMVATAAMREIGADPSYVGVIGWPSPVEAADIGGMSHELGLAYLNVSPAVIEGPAAPASAGSRMVATDREQADVVARYIAQNLHGRDTCLASDEGPRGIALLRWVRRGLSSRDVKVSLEKVVPAQRSDYLDLSGAVADAGCSILFWGGGGTEGGLISTEIAGEGIRMVGVDTLIGEPFTTTAGPAGEGTVATCPCADVSTGADLQTQRFIQEYQSRYGGPPSVFAAEGWDAAQRFLSVMGAGALDRIAVAKALGAQRGFDGLAGDYLFDRNGQLKNAPVFIYRETNDGWVVLGPDDRVIGR